MFTEFREGERERNINQLSPICTLIGDWTHNLAMDRDWELNPQLLVYGTKCQPTEPPDQGTL